MRAEDIPSTIGTLMCNPTTSQAYAQSLHTFLTTSTNLKKRLKRQSEVLAQAFRALSQQLKAFAEIVKELTMLQDTQPEAFRHKVIYGELVAGLETWSAHESEVAEQVTTAFGSFFKYRYNEASSMRDILKERDNHLNVYLKAARALVAKKEQLWTKGDIMKWDMKPEDISIGIERLKADKDLAFSKMLHQESAQVERLKELYGFYNFQLQSEVARIWADASELESVHFNSFAQLHTQLLGSVTAQWKQMYARTKHLAVSRLSTGVEVST